MKFCFHMKFFLFVNKTPTSSCWNLNFKKPLNAFFSQFTINWTEIFLFSYNSTKWAEIWNVGSSDMLEYGTNVILNFKGLATTPNNFLLLFSCNSIIWAEIWYVGSLDMLNYGTDAILNFEGPATTKINFLPLFSYNSTK